MENEYMGKKKNMKRIRRQKRKGKRWSKGKWSRRKERRQGGGMKDGYEGMDENEK